MTSATINRLANALFIEDSASEIRLLKQRLDKDNVQFDGHWVVNGEDALKFLRHDPGFEKAPRPDVIFLDLHLPQLNGEDVLHAIQADQTLSTIPVVVLTQSDFEDDVISMRDLGAAHYLVKPLDYDKLVEAVALIDTLRLERDGKDWNLVPV
ncbi:MAG TPA: response regulator [Asticcacaulis sp.]|nr:response regulator [Asticcacaulis sp.]